MFVEQEGSRIWSEDCGVYDQNQNDPVPDRLEWRIVEDSKFAVLESFQVITLVIFVQQISRFILVVGQIGSKG